MQKKSRNLDAANQNQDAAGKFSILGVDEMKASVRKKILATYALLPLEVSAWLESETDFSESHVDSMIRLLFESAEFDSDKN